MKSLVALIDESLAEIEELKKSDRFSASEIKIEGPGSGIAGKPVNGSLGKDDDKDEEDEDEDDEDDKDMDKGEGKNSQSDPSAGHHKMDKAEDKKKDKEKDEDDDDDKDDKKMAFMKKSAEEANTLLKSYVDQRLAPIESKLEAIIGLVKQVADAPAAPAKGVSYRGVTPLNKSQDEGEPLTKSLVVEKLFELQKSGAKVNVVDITSAELAGPAELAKIANKYNIK